MSESVSQLSRKAAALCKSNDFETALPILQMLWTNHRAACNEWDGWRYAQALRKTGRVSDALKVCREVYQLKPDFSHNNNLYGWCIYDLYIKEVPEDENKFFRAAQAIVDLTRHEEYSPYEKTVFRVLRYLKESESKAHTESQRKHLAQLVLKWSAYLSPSQLSVQEQKIPTSEGEFRQASPREQWYNFRTKALLEVGQYADCIQVCQAALSEPLAFHNDADIWFQWRIGKAQAYMGNLEQSANTLKSILPRKKAWYVYFALAETLQKLGQPEQALQAAIDGALTLNPRDELSHMWELFVLIGELLLHTGKVELAQRHFGLALQLRREQGWQIPQRLQNVLQDFSLSGSLPESRQLFKDLRQFWMTHKPMLTGRVQKVIGDGQAGFILGEDNKEYYFRRDDFPRDVAPEVGMSVRFIPEEGWDRKKGRVSWVAKRVRPENKSRHQT